jgi:AcrR family transcriptional regulator
MRSECTVTHMPRTLLSTSAERREILIDRAISAFSRSGYIGTSVATVAAEAGISPAYVFKLFPTKEQLFVAALDRCFEQILAALEAGAELDTTNTPTGILDAMGLAYAHLIADRELLMLQVHAQSAADVPEIGDALRRGLAAVTRFAKTRSGSADEDVQRFVAFGQLCHLIVTLQIDAGDGNWAAILAEGIRHPEPSAH